MCAPLCVATELWCHSATVPTAQRRMPSQLHLRSATINASQVNMIDLGLLPLGSDGHQRHFPGSRSCTLEIGSIRCRDPLYISVHPGKGSMKESKPCGNEAGYEYQTRSGMSGCSHMLVSPTNTSTTPTKAHEGSSGRVGCGTRSANLAAQPHLSTCCSANLHRGEGNTAEEKRTYSR